ncbi:MAG: outer membrane protein [Candidatus Saganbacteria bacterium]|uniref:Outer membrane protein n=1 Tax=Candidatus Saganbacteria bacterium TaxID=2575572 RepID=A0A833L240_UNCSA|nr:MAG: outer membrane protein [Candidatus Saganbacteria bacterium]
MKKVAISLIALMVIGGAAFAQSAASSMGFVDIQKVFKDYKETSKAQKELAKEEETFKKEFEESQKKLEEAQKNGKSKEEIDKMRASLEEKLAPKRDSLLKLNEKLTLSLQKNIVVAVTKIAQKLGLESVLDKQVIIYGGMDITDMVVSELNK